MAWLDWQDLQDWTLKWSRSLYIPRSSLSRRHNFQYFTFKHDGFCRYLHQGSFWSFAHGFISSLPHPECSPSSSNQLLQGIRLLGWSFVSHITNIGNWLFLRFFFFASKETSFSRQLMDIDFLPNIVNSIFNFWRYNLHLIDFLKPIWQASFSSIVVWNNFYYVWMHFHHFMFILLFLCSSPSLLLFDLSGSYILYYGILSTWTWPISTVLPKHYLKSILTLIFPQILHLFWSSISVPLFQYLDI